MSGTARSTSTSFIPSFNRDTKILIAQRFIRTIAYGTSTLILIQYLSSLPGFTPSSIGLFQAATLWGDVGVSLLLTIYADRLGKRRVLAVGCLGMIGAGAVFAWGVMDLEGEDMLDGWWRWVIMSFASIVGVISPSGNEVGPFKAVEESMLADLNPKSTLATTYAFYSLFGSAGSALGMFTCGLTLQFLQARMDSKVGPYRVAFLVYMICGMVKLWLTMMLSEETEGKAKAKEVVREATAYQQIKQDDEEESTGLMEASEEIEITATSTNNTDRSVRTTTSTIGHPLRPPTLSERIGKFLTPNIPKRYLPILIRLCIIFTVDSIGSGLASASWVTFYFDSHFGMEPASLGSLFTVTNLISSGMSLVAARLAQALGNLPTMVVTHLPSAIFLASLPLAQQSQTVSIVLVLCRSALQSMDSAPRQAFIAGAVDSDGRTAVMGIINVVKTASQSLGPFLTGLFAQGGYLAWGIGMGGVMKIIYNLLLIWMMLSGRGER